MKVLANIAISMVLVSTAQAASPRIPPRYYRVDGRPVPVSCLEVLSNLEGDSPSTIDLRKCGDPSVKPKAQADGSIGYEKSDGGYFYYHYVGRSDGIDILSLESSGGGSGRFTQLVGVKYGGQVIRRVKDYAGGDRCNGGVSGERVSNGKLRFDQAITPYDLIKLARPKENIEAYEDLEASAASCVGLSHMIDDHTHWTGVSLTQNDWSDQPGWTEKYRYQACFNRLYRETIASGHSELDRTSVARFAQAFGERCVREPPRP